MDNYVKLGCRDRKCKHCCKYRLAPEAEQQNRGVRELMKLVKQAMGLLAETSQVHTELTKQALKEARA